MNRLIGGSARFVQRVALALVLLAMAPGEARADLTTGNIAGRVTDELTGKPVAGVTVTITGPALPGEQNELTDSAGHYIVTNLPTGEYMVRFYYANVTVERPGVLVTLDKTLSVNVLMRTDQARTQIFRITEHAPSVDVANAQVQTSITEDLVRNVPVGRTYSSVLTLAPGAALDPVGLSVNGATGPENLFLLDGANTTSPNFGLLGTPLSLEFVKSTEIITAGYNAEYGRSTGGVVNVITKSGGNELHGGAWFFYTPTMLNPNRIDRPGEAVASIRRFAGADGRGADHAIDFGFDLGGPIVKNRIWFYAGFAPSFVTESYDRILRTRTADKLDPTQASGSYAGDPPAQAAECPAWLAAQDKALCAPSQTQVARTADLGQRYSRHYESQSRLYNVIGKLNFRIDDNHALSVAYVGSPSSFDGAFQNPHDPSLPNLSFLGINGNPDAVQFKNDIQVHDLNAHYTGKFLKKQLLLDVIAAFHVESNDTIPTAAAAAVAQNIDLRGNMPLATYEPGVTPCAPTTIHGVSFNPCPVSNYLDGGYGYISNLLGQRFSVSAGVTYFARFFGTHAIKLGGDFEDNVYRDHRQYSGGAGGGEFLTALDPQVGLVVRRRQFASFDPNDPTRPILLTNGLTAETSSLNEALYLRDSYNLSFLPGMTLNLGVRWEAQQMNDVSGKTQIGIFDNIAPRVGFIYDFLGKGRSKIYANFGRYFESIPLDLADRQFSGEGFANQYASATDCGFAPGATSARVDTSKCNFGPLKAGDIRGGKLAVVAPGLQGQYSDEMTAGLQYDVGYDIVLGAAYVHRELGRIVEDIHPDGDINSYFIGNPGQANDPAVVQSLRNQIASAKTPTDVDRLTRQLSLYQSQASYQPPKRDYNALIVTASKRLSHNFVLLASYTFSRTIGNYPGLFQGSTGQLDPNISSQYDLRELLINRTGALPNDRPHNFKLAGAYYIPFGGDSGLTLGLNFTALSGTPIDVLGGHPWGLNESFILPRGSGGRTPTVTQLDLRVAWSRRFEKNLRAELSADVFNILNEQAVTQVDPQYTTDNVLPIQNGTPADLPSLKTTSGAQPHLNPNFGQPTQYQVPLTARFGARISF